MRESDERHDWFVRPIASSERSYTCPGCQQLVTAGTAHVVVWPADDIFGDAAGIERRRHWHTACWRRRGNLF